jgi:hypothetical protein
VAESPSAVPALPGLAVAAVEWLPSGAESGLVRVRGRWTDETAREPDLPVFVLLAQDGEHRFDSLPDARFSRDPDSWRGTYLVPAELVAVDPEALWLEWPSGARSGLPALKRGVEPPPVPAAPERPEEPDEPGGQVIDRAVLAERRAKRAEAAEQASARVAGEALKAVEVLELRSAELERRLEEASEVDDGGRDALAAALASAAESRARSREWQRRMRNSEMLRAGDAVRLAVLESERATGAEALRGALAERSAELEALRARVAAHEAERAQIDDLRRRVEDERASGEAVRAELERAGAELRSRVAELEAALAATEHRLGEAESALAGAEERFVAAESARADAEGRFVAAESARAETEGRLEVETVARTTLEDELDRERTAFEAELAAAREASEAELAAARESSAATLAALEAERAVSADLRTALDAERAARTAAEAALAAARAEGATFLDRIAELERRAAPENVERLAREQAEAAAAREPAGDSARVVADLDAAAEALRRRTAPTLEDEPPAPDAEPAEEWPDSGEPEREPCTPGVEPVRAPGEHREPLPWSPPGYESVDADEPDEPPAPDAEPGVEWHAPEEPPPAATATVVVAPAPPTVPSPEQPVVVAPPAATPSQPPPAATPLLAEPVVVAPASPAEPVAPASPAPAPPPAVEKPSGPVIVSAPKPPSRAAMVGSDRRDYPLLRGAIVKLAHDDAATAARLLTALLPAQGAAIEGPLAYDVTIGEAGTYGVAIAGGRASVERLESPHKRGLAEFHLIADPVMLAELLAGVEHRIGRFFGPIRARGRKRRLKDLQPLTNGAVTVAQAARAGARLDPELAYRVLSYAVHPSWTRGHAFTIAQEITGDPPETWYLTARDGAGLTVSATAPEEPVATVSMSREAFDRLLRDEPIPPGRRPCVRGDLEAVATMRAWTDRARGA